MIGIAENEPDHEAAKLGIAWADSGRRGWVRLALVPARSHGDPFVLPGVLAEDRR